MDAFGDGHRPRRVLSSGILHRSLDPAIARQVAEIDPRLVVEWAPEGIWWTPASMVPPGATLGCWRIGIRGYSGQVRWMRMWHPECGDGLIVDYLKSTWGHKLYILRSTTMKPATKAQRLAQVNAMQRKAEQEAFDAMWNAIDHGEAYVAGKAEPESPKWRQGWNVPANLPTAPDKTPVSEAKAE